jgi:hypothetical protein
MAHPESFASCREGRVQPSPHAPRAAKVAGVNSWHTGSGLPACCRLGRRRSAAGTARPPAGPLRLGKRLRAAGSRSAPRRPRSGPRGTPLPWPWALHLRRPRRRPDARLGRNLEDGARYGKYAPWLSEAAFQRPASFSMMRVNDLLSFGGVAPSKRHNPLIVSWTSFGHRFFARFCSTQAGEPSLFLRPRHTVALATCSRAEKRPKRGRKGSRAR